MTSPQKVDVEMKYRLPRSWTHVQHGPVSLLNVPLTCNLSRSQVAAADHFSVFSLRFFQSTKMSLGDNQYMGRSLRVDIFEGQHVLVLVNFLRGNLAAENAAEKAVAGGVGHGILRREDSIDAAAYESCRCSVGSTLGDNLATDH
jgi:hypothetical protein